MTHTPGPWDFTGPSPGKMKGYDDGGDYAIIARGIIAEAFHRIDDDTYADAEANARLIAAAPDLLEALENALAYFINAHEHDCTGWDCAECYPQIMAGKVEQAIAKAEGGE